MQHNGKRGTYAMMADGSVRFINQNISDNVFKAMCTIGGGAPEDFETLKKKYTTPVKFPREEVVPEEKFVRPPTAPPVKENKAPKGDAGTQPTGKVPAGWASFKSPVFAYSLAFPVQPTEVKANAPVVGVIRTFVAKVPNKQMPLLTVAIPVPAEELKGSQDVMFSTFALGFAGSSGAKIESQTKITCASFAGREFRYASKNPMGGPPLVGHLRVYLVRNHVLMLISPLSGNPPSAETTAFFNSLKIDK